MEIIYEVIMIDVSSIIFKGKQKQRINKDKHDDIYFSLRQGVKDKKLLLCMCIGHNVAKSIGISKTSKVKYYFNKKFWYFKIEDEHNSDGYAISMLNRKHNASFFIPTDLEGKKTNRSILISPLHIEIDHKSKIIAIEIESYLKNL